MQTLAFYWLRTVLGSGYDHREWKTLDRLVRQLPQQDAAWRQTSTDLQTWMRQARFPGNEVPHPPASVSSAGPPSLKNAVLRPYVARLLNEWLPVEVARLLVNESDKTNREDAGIPALATARAIERLLVRERLSGGTLQALLQPGLLSPRIAYPADVEILRDVVLFLLGRTEAPPFPVIPATLLCVLPDSPLAADYANAVEGALLGPASGPEEIHVPIPADKASQVLKSDRVRMGSILVSMDGRWWQANRLIEDGEFHRVVYQPSGRLEIDYSTDHTRLSIPWPEVRSNWSGPVELAVTLEIFGRQWHIERWEQDMERTWLHLVFQQPLPISRVTPSAESNLRRTRPAAVDMAWAAVENALEDAVSKTRSDVIENLRQADLIPVGRALFALIETVASRGLGKRENIVTRLNSVAYLQAELVPSYGRVPWRILPEVVRTILLTHRSYQEFAELLNDVFDGFPVASIAAKQAIPGAGAGSDAKEADAPANSPRHVA